MFRQLSKSEVKEIADIMLKEVFLRAEEKGIKIDVTERFKVHPPRDLVQKWMPRFSARTRRNKPWLVDRHQTANQND